MKRSNIGVGVIAVVLAAVGADADFISKDPGVRGGASGAGSAITGLTAGQHAFFDAGRTDFADSETLADGLGPRFNLDSCAGCHAQPEVGGSSPAVNPQIAVATAFGAKNTVPSFITLNGPVREVRFKRKADGSPDGGVHALFVVSGRNDGSANATGCGIKQPAFDAQVAANNVIFRIPTPTFGTGLIEQIPDATILANRNANALAKAALGITGRANVNGNDGTVARFGWKAQNKSLLLFSGEAYNVEMGISNDIFQNERDETPECQFTTTPNDVANPDGATPLDATSAIEKFTFFMRFLAAPAPSADTPGGATSIARGRTTFSAIGCALCHTPALQTGDATVAALANKTAALYSDLLLHNMGPGLADDVSQGGAAGDEFRTAPLWGLGQRIFFLHDGRTTDLKQAIREHKSAGNGVYKASEANGVVTLFNALPEAAKQDLLNFLRSL